MRDSFTNTLASSPVLRCLRTVTRFSLYVYDVTADGDGFDELSPTKCRTV